MPVFSGVEAEDSQVELPDGPHVPRMELDKHRNSALLCFLGLCG